MGKTVVKPTRFTPYIMIDPSEGVVKFEGKSSPENAIQFYSNVLSNISDISNSDTKKIDATFKLSYFNTSSAKCLFNVIMLLESKLDEGLDVSVNWYYEQEDEDMLETGEDFEALSDIPFKFLTHDYQPSLVNEDAFEFGNLVTIDNI